MLALLHPWQPYTACLSQPVVKMGVTSQGEWVSVCLSNEMYGVVAPTLICLSCELSGQSPTSGNSSCSSRERVQRGKWVGQTGRGKYSGARQRTLECRGGNLRWKKEKSSLKEPQRGVRGRSGTCARQLTKSVFGAFNTSVCCALLLGSKDGISVGLLSQRPFYFLTYSLLPLYF